VDQRRRVAVFLMPPASPPVTRRIRPSAVLLLSGLCLAAALAFLPDYWDWDLHRLREVIRRDGELAVMYAGSIQVVAAERRASEEARRTAREVARVKGRVTGSIRGLFDLFVTDIVQQPDGKIVVVGFHNVPGVGVARLNVDGSLDQEFVRHANWETAGLLTGVPEQVTLAPDGNVLVSGRFDFEGRRHTLVRFRPDGTLDGPFLSAAADLPPDADLKVVPRPGGLPELMDGVGGQRARFQYLGALPDGRTLAVRTRVVPSYVPGLCGNEPTPRESHLVRIGSDGTLDELQLGAPLCQASSPLLDVRAVAFQRDGGVLMAGDLPFLRRIGLRDECEHFAIWRITPSGALDPQFRKTALPELVVGQEAATVNKILVLDDGRIVIGGAFASVQGQARVHLALLRPDGSVE
jgi:uncharacterized delta-60 repeat protein